MNKNRNFTFLIISLSLFLILVASNQILAQDEYFVNPPDVDLSFTNTQYDKNEKELFGYQLEVKMYGDIPQFRVVEKVYSSLNFLAQFHQGVLEEMQRVHFSRRFQVDLKIDSNVPIRVLKKIEFELIQLNHRKINFLNSNGEKLKIYLPPNSDECYGGCCLANGQYCLTEKVEVRKGVFENVISSFPTESECWKYLVSETGVFVHLTKDNMLIDGVSVSMDELIKRLRIKHNQLKEKFRFIVILKVDEDAIFEEYLKMYAAVFNFYYDERNKISLEKANLPFNKTSKKIRKEIRNEIPIVIKKVYD